MKNRITAVAIIIALVVFIAFNVQAGTTNSASNEGKTTHMIAKQLSDQDLALLEGEGPAPPWIRRISRAYLGTMDTICVGAGFWALLSRLNPYLAAWCVGHAAGRLVGGWLWH